MFLADFTDYAEYYVLCVVVVLIFTTKTQCYFFS